MSKTTFIEAGDFVKWGEGEFGYGVALKHTQRETVICAFPYPNHCTWDLIAVPESEVQLLRKQEGPGKQGGWVYYDNKRAILLEKDASGRRMVVAYPDEYNTFHICAHWPFDADTEPPKEDPPKEKETMSVVFCKGDNVESKWNSQFGIVLAVPTPDMCIVAWNKGVTWTVSHHDSQNLHFLCHAKEDGGYNVNGLRMLCNKKKEAFVLEKHASGMYTVACTSETAKDGYEIQKWSQDLFLKGRKAFLAKTAKKDENSIAIGTQFDISEYKDIGGPNAETKEEKKEKEEKEKEEKEETPKEEECIDFYPEENQHMHLVKVYDSRVVVKMGYKMDVPTVLQNKTVKVDEHTQLEFGTHSFRLVETYTK